MNARIVLDVKRKIADVAHLSTKALDPEVRQLVAALSDGERAKLRTLALLVVRATQPDEK